MILWYTARYDYNILYIYIYSIYIHKCYIPFCCSLYTDLCIWWFTGKLAALMTLMNILCPSSPWRRSTAGEPVADRCVGEGVCDRWCSQCTTHCAIQCDTGCATQPRWQWWPSSSGVWRRNARLEDERSGDRVRVEEFTIQVQGYQELLFDNFLEKRLLQI